MNKELKKEVEEVLKNLKFVNVYVQEKENQKKKIQNGDRGAVQAVVNDLIKVSPTNSVSSRIESEAISNAAILTILDFEIYKQQENERLINKALEKMTKEQQEIYINLYEKEKSLKETAKILGCSPGTLIKNKKDFLEKIAVSLYGKDALKVKKNDWID